MMKKEMKAAVFSGFDGPKSVTIDNIEIPELKEGEVLVKVKAAGVNPVDAVITNGYYKDMLPHSFPVISGWDLAGTIEDRGHAARKFSVGEDVYAYARRPEVKWGTYAEYIVIPESYLSKKPVNISFEEAAGIPLAGLTAYQGLFDSGKLEKGQRVLIVGASGGVGGFAIQLAKNKGAEVIGVASAENSFFMKQLGADHTIDYKKQDIGKAARDIYEDGVDLIFDCNGADSMKQSLKALKPGGRVVSTLSQGEGVDKDIDFNFVFVEPNSSQLDELRGLADTGKLKVEITRSFTLEEAPEALEQIQSSHTTGKMVVVP